MRCTPILFALFILVLAFECDARPCKKKPKSSVASTSVKQSDAPTPTATTLSFSSSSTPTSQPVANVAGSPSASPTPGSSSSSNSNSKFAVTEAQLLKIAPGSSSCANANPAAANECRTAAQAVGPISDSFKKYGIATKGEKAALISLMTFETGNFQFDRNQAGVAGQGTRNEMMFPFVLQYAESIPSTASKAKSLVPNADNVSDDVKNQVLQLVLPDELSFASAAWYYKESGQCDESIQSGLKAGTSQGWQDYITKCVGTTVTGPREDMYNAAMSAL